MNSPFLETESAYQAWRAKLDTMVDPERALPEQVFRVSFDRYRFEEFDWAMSSESWTAFKALAKECGDDSVVIGVLDPDPVDYFAREFNWYGWAEIPIDATAEDYWSILSYQPESQADSLLANSERLIWTSESQGWCAWGGRSIEVCVLGVGAESIAAGTWKSLSWVSEYLSADWAGDLEALESSLRLGFDRD